MSTTTERELDEYDDYDDLDDADEREPATPSLLVRLGAELVGTFILVTAIIVVATFGSLGTTSTALHVALAGGLALTALVVAFGSVSGAHLNPAVSLGAAVAGRLSWADLAPYVVAQTLGGVAAGALLRTIIPSSLPAALGAADTKAVVSTVANGFGTHSPIATLSGGQVTFSTAQALVVEAVATAILVGVVLAVTRKPIDGAPLAIGGTLTVGILIAAQVTNAALNPARATATAFFAESWALSQVWLFWVAPLLGGLIAGLIAAMLAPQPAVVDEWDDDDEDEDDEDGEDDETVASDPSDPAHVEVESEEPSNEDDSDAEDLDGDGQADPESDRPRD